MDIVLVGLPGSGKSVVGKRLANRHAATFIDLDERIERADGRPIPTIFAEDGEAAFRRIERDAVEALGPADPDGLVHRVIATGGGAVVDPRNRWALYRGRIVVWLDGRPEVLAQRLRRSPHVRPLVQGRDPIGTLRELGAKRERFYAAADIHIAGVADVATVVTAVESHLAERERAPQPGTRLLSAATPIGRIVIGDGIAASAVDAALGRLEARRALIVSEPGAWNAVGSGIAAGLEARGRAVATVLLPEGEAAKRLSVIETAASELSQHHISRGEPIIAIGGGALGDTAGFLAATYLRGVPWIGVPTTMVAQLDSSIGGKTGVDLPDGKNLVGSFHPPAAIVTDIALLRSLPERQLRAALGEAVKMAVLGDERLFTVLETDGPAIARGEPAAFESGAVAEVVERAAWAKVAVVEADEHEQGADQGRVSLNLGHSLGHAIEAAGGFSELLHGEAVAYGLRGAVRIGRALGATPPELAGRVEELLTAVGLATEPLPYSLDSVRAALAKDKKHADGALRWVLPTAAGYEIRSDVPADLVVDIATGLLAGAPVAGAER
jgi:shikimate kinase/3-dehydroquinate synthase